MILEGSGPGAHDITRTLTCDKYTIGTLKNDLKTREKDMVSSQNDCSESVKGKLSFGFPRRHIGRSIMEHQNAHEHCGSPAPCPKVL